MLSTELLRARPKVVTTTPLSFSQPKTRHRTTDTKRLTSIPTPKQFQETPFSHSTGELRLGWLETSIRSYSKYVDVAAKATANADDEAEVWRHERMALEEVQALLDEMRDDEDR